MTISTTTSTISTLSPVPGEPSRTITVKCYALIPYVIWDALKTAGVTDTRAIIEKYLSSVILNHFRGKLVAIQWLISNKYAFHFPCLFICVF